MLLGGKEQNVYQPCKDLEVRPGGGFISKNGANRVQMVCGGLLEPISVGAGV